MVNIYRILAFMGYVPIIAWGISWGYKRVDPDGYPEKEGGIEREYTVIKNEMFRQKHY